MIKFTIVLVLAAWFLSLVAHVGATTQQALLDENIAKWDNFTNYTNTSYIMEFERSCFCWLEELGPFLVVVDSTGAIVVAVYLEGSEYPGMIVPDLPEDLNIFTIPDAFRDIQDALNHAYLMNVTYHVERGFPTEVYIDWYGDAIDDEMCYTIKNVSLVL